MHPQRMLILMSALALVGLGQSRTLAEPLDPIKACLPKDGPKVEYSLVQEISDPKAEADPNPNRPVKYYQVVTTGRSVNWFNLIAITKDQQCINFEPEQNLGLNYEKYAPWEIALQLATSDAEISEKKRQELLEYYNNLPPEQQGYDEIPYNCTLSAAEFEARESLQLDNEGCTAAEKEEPIWTQQ